MNRILWHSVPTLEEMEAQSVPVGAICMDVHAAFCMRTFTGIVNLATGATSSFGRDLDNILVPGLCRDNGPRLRPLPSGRIVLVF